METSYIILTSNQIEGFLRQEQAEKELKEKEKNENEEN